MLYVRIVVQYSVTVRMQDQRREGSNLLVKMRSQQRHGYFPLDIHVVPE